MGTQGEDGHPHTGREVSGGPALLVPACILGFSLQDREPVHVCCVSPPSAGLC